MHSSSFWMQKILKQFMYIMLVRILLKFAR